MGNVELGFSASLRSRKMDIPSIHPLVWKKFSLIILLYWGQKEGILSSSWWLKDLFNLQKLHKFQAGSSSIFSVAEATENKEDKRALWSQFSEGKTLYSESNLESSCYIFLFLNFRF